MKKKLFTVVMALCLIVTMMPTMSAFGATITDYSIDDLEAVIRAEEGWSVSQLTCSVPTGDKFYTAGIAEIKRVISSRGAFNPTNLDRNNSNTGRVNTSKINTSKLTTRYEDVTNIVGGAKYRLKVVFTPDSNYVFPNVTKGENFEQVPGATVSFTINGNKTTMVLANEGTEKNCGWMNYSGKAMWVYVEFNAPKTEVTGINAAPATDSLELEVGKTMQLSAQLIPSNVTDPTVIWESADESIATVKSGLLTGVKAGKTTVKAYAYDNKAVSKSWTVNVKAEEQKLPEQPVQPEQPVLPEQPTQPTAPSASGQISDPATGEKVDQSFAGMDIDLDYTATAYSGKAKQPGVTIQDNVGHELIEGIDYELAYYNNKDVGKAVVIVKGLGSYAGTTAGKNFTIKPKSVKTTSLKKAAAGKLTLKWKSHKTQTTGFQIRYSTTKSFKSGTYKNVTVSKKSATSKTVSKLKKGKTYYVKIRAYKTVDGKKIYSSWSMARKVKV